MSDVFRELIDEYQNRSKPEVPELFREMPELFREISAAGEFFYDTKRQMLYIAGYGDDGELTWFVV